MKKESYNIHTLYFSPTGTTKSAVNGIAKGFNQTFTQHDLTLPSNRQTLPQFTKDDLVIVGIPVYSGRVPRIIEEHINALKGHKTPIILTTVYGNRDIDDALVELQDMVSSSGFIPVGGAAFIGEHSFTSDIATNRPDSNDLLIADQFAKDIARLLETSNLESISLQPRGHRPYKERKTFPPLAPIISNDCNQCRTCVNLCPASALSQSDDGSIITDGTKCILCCRCVKGCEQSAIAFDQRVPDFITFLKANCSHRIEPELFIGTTIV